MAAIEQLGGKVFYGGTFAKSPEFGTTADPAWPRWLRHHFVCVLEVDLSGTKAKDGDLSHLSSFPHLSRLDLSNTKTTDAAVGCLTGLRDLKELSIGGTGLTGDAVRKLEQALPGCMVRR